VRSPSSRIARCLAGQRNGRRQELPGADGGTFSCAYGSDSDSVTPPADGYILSGGKTDARDCVNFTHEEMSKKLNRPFNWPLLSVTPGQTLEVKWEYTAPHTTRGYRWMITKDGWDPKQRISRAQLEAQPFAEDFYTQVPYYSYPGELKAKGQSFGEVAGQQKGRHVIVLMWIVANTGNAFYQAFDVDFK
jgi:chitin-binding protein